MKLPESNKTLVHEFAYETDICKRPDLVQLHGYTPADECGELPLNIPDKYSYTLLAPDPGI